MVSVARRNLFRERGRLGLSVAGVAFSVMLILVLAGVYAGFQESATAYVMNSGADIFVAQEGTTDMFHSFSILPLALAGRIAEVEGVSTVHPLISRQVEVHIGDAHARTAVIGYEGLGGPWRLVRGSGEPGPGDIVVDKVFAANNHLEVGDRLAIGAEEFRVIGVSEGTNLFVFQYAFLRFEDASGLVLPMGTTTFFLVEVADGVDPDDTAAGIEQGIPGVVAFPAPAFAESNSEVVLESFDPILLVLYAIGGLTGILVIGLTVYTATIERTREYGVLKAIGASQVRLFGILLGQAQYIATIGFLAGLALTALAVLAVAALVPVIHFAFPPLTFPLLLGATMAMGALAAYIPWRRVVRIDPAVVFRRG